MKLQINILFDNEHVDKFEMNVGKGRQTFKWLGLAVAKRLSILRPKGSVRARERRVFVPEDMIIIPSNIYSEKRCFYHPHAIVGDSLIKEEDSTTTSKVEILTVELQSTFPRQQQTGVLNMTRWATIAFMKGCNEMCEEIKRIEAEAQADVEKQEEDRLIISSRMKREYNEPRLKIMKELLNEQLLDEAMMQTLMKREWDIITTSGILNDCIPPDVDCDLLEKVYNVILANYTYLSDLYKHLAAINSGGSSAALEYMEYTQFLSSIDFNTHDESQTIMKIFLNSQIQDKNNSTNSNKSNSLEKEIRQSEFVVCLLRLAIFKFIDSPSKEARNKKEQDHENNIISNIEVPSIPNAFQMLFDDYLKPYIDSQLHCAAIRKLLGSDDVLLLLHQNLDDIKSVYDYFSTFPTNGTTTATTPNRKEEVTQGNNSTMALKEFTAFVESSGFLVVEDEEIKANDDKINNKYNRRRLLAKDIRQIFASSQHDHAENESEQQIILAKENDRNAHLEVMVFPEFIEALLRLAVLRWRDPSTPLTQKLQLAILKAMSSIHTSF